MCLILMIRTVLQNVKVTFLGGGEAEPRLRLRGGEAELEEEDDEDDEDELRLRRDLGLTAVFSLKCDNYYIITEYHNRADHN